MKLKLFKKYFFTTSVIIVISLTFMMLILSFVLNNYIAESKYKTLTKACVEIVEHIEDYAEYNKQIDIKNFYNLIITVSDVSESDIFIADSNSKVLICSCNDYRENKSCMHSSAVISKDIFENKPRFSDNKSAFLSTLGIYKKPHYVAVENLTSETNQVYGTVFSTSPMSSVNNLLSTITKLFLFSAILPIIIMFFAIYAMTYRLTKPLKLMSEASKAMAKGDFSKRIPVMSDDEIGELSASFNMMTNSLAQLEGMRKSFVANISHELKTPMTTIGGFIDGILDGTIEAEKQEYYLNIVSDEVKRLSRLVQSMLSMTRLESGEFALNPEAFDLRELICTIVVSGEQRIDNQKINIIGLDSLQSITVSADRDLIHQAIYNIVDNAIKFTDENGSISFSLKAENKRAVLNVVNTGKGIPQKDLPLIFERFYKVDKSRSSSKNSTGLGLYIVKTIINAHGGKITVSSKENEFTAFKIVLPINLN